MRPLELGSFSSLKNQVFRRLWLAHQTSNFAELMQLSAAAWIMTTLTSSDIMVTLVQTAAAAPVMLFSLISGAIADSYDRRSVMILAKASMLASSLILVGLIAAGWVVPLALLFFVFAISAGAAFYLQSWQATIGSLVSRQGLPSAVILNSTGINLNRTIAPSISGLTFATIGTAAPFLVSILGNSVLIYALVTWRRPAEPAIGDERNLGTAILAGFRYLGHSLEHRSITARAFLFGTGASATNALLPIVSTSVLDLSSVGFGLLSCAFGFGALLAALSLGTIQAKLGFERTLFVSSGGSIIGTLILGTTTNLAMVSLGVGVAGACWFLSFSSLKIATQLLSARHITGRMQSIFHTVVFSGIALGSLLWGLTAEYFDLGCAFIASSAVLAGGIVVGIRFPVKCRFDE
ncbi:MFS transporter [Sinorhizobium meliloti]|uniref:MFS transporter n=1 Tax=Rhizobium meliloti TaxID=382 RepID=UPI0012952B8F|nr:MFS transporter [Sinorhizobium meliloti]MQX58185.1 MFS transporter [Sinorhizobium meliloti]